MHGKRNSVLQKPVFLDLALGIQYASPIGSHPRDIQPMSFGRKNMERGREKGGKM
jgi:hypothetical protein